MDEKSTLKKILKKKFIKNKQYYLKLLAKLNPFPNKPWFLPVCSASLLKTL